MLKTISIQQKINIGVKVVLYPAVAFIDHLKEVIVNWLLIKYHLHGGYSLHKDDVFVAFQRSPQLLTMPVCS